MILVTGTGRSGTHYIAKVLKELGYDVPHESVGRDGAASWKHIVSGTFTYIGKNREAAIDSSGFTKMLHQVRHPIKTIASMQTFSDSTWHFMSEHIPLDITAPPLVKGMQAWVGWNALIESKKPWRFQIERIKEIFPEFCEQAGISPADFPTVAQSARDSRTTRYSPIKFNELRTLDVQLSEEVTEMAERYGYHEIERFSPSVSKKSRSNFGRIFGK